MINNNKSKIMWIESTTGFIYNAYVFLIMLFIHTDSKLQQKKKKATRHHSFSVLSGSQHKASNSNGGGDSDPHPDAVRYHSTVRTSTRNQKQNILITVKPHSQWQQYNNWRSQVVYCWFHTLPTWLQAVSGQIPHLQKVNICSTFDASVACAAKNQ